MPLLRDVLKRERVIVLVDELDRGWDASEDAKAFVAGLFQACMSVNGLSDNLRVYMSLRQELYDNIPALYEDAQKFRDVIEIISWDEGSLQKLLAKRIKHRGGLQHRQLPASRHGVAVAAPAGKASPVLRTWPHRCCSARCRRRTPRAFMQVVALCAERRASRRYPVEAVTPATPSISATSATSASGLRTEPWVAAWGRSGRSA